MRPRSALAALALSALLAGTPGCSILLVRGPSSGPEPTAGSSCTRSNAIPFLDAALAGTSLLVGGTLVATYTGDAQGWTAPYAVVGAGFVVEGLVFGASSLVGFHRTGRCRAAQAAVPAR
jgi:hypothetical protein